MEEGMASGGDPGGVGGTVKGVLPWRGWCVKPAGETRLATVLGGCSGQEEQGAWLCAVEGEVRTPGVVQRVGRRK